MADETSDPTLKVRIVTEADAQPLQEHAAATNEAAEAVGKLAEKSAAAAPALEREAAALEKDAAAAHRASEEFQRFERERKIVDLSGPGVADSMSPEEIAAAEARRRAGKPSVGGALLTPFPDLGAAPRAVADVDEQIRGLRENTLAAKHELADLLDRPGERTRREIEQITELQGVLRANAQEARQFAGGASPLVAAQLFALAKQADQSARIESAYRAKAPAAPSDPAAPANPGMTATEAAALGAGLRTAGQSGGFFTGAMARAVEQVGLLRIALLGLVGAGIGGLIAALVGVVGYLGRGAVATKEFQDGLANAKKETGELGEQVNRATKPVTDFLGRIGGKALDFFAEQLDKAETAMARLNNEVLKLPDFEAPRRALERYAEEAQGLANKLDGIAAAGRKMNDELAASNAKLGDLFASKNKTINAKLELDLSEVDAAEGRGDYTAPQAAAERQRLRAAAENETLANQAKLLKVQADQAAVRETDAAWNKADADLAVAQKQRELDELMAKSVPSTPSREEVRRRLEVSTRPVYGTGVPGMTVGNAANVTEKNVDAAMEEERVKAAQATKRLDESRGKASEELMKAMQAADQINTAFQQARDNADALGNELAAANMKMRTASNKQTAEEANLKKQQTAEGLEEELKAIDTAHRARVAAIENSGRAEIIKRAQLANEEKRYQEERLHRANELDKLRGNDSPADRAAAAQSANDAIAAKQRELDAAIAQATKPGAEAKPRERAPHFGTDGIEIGKGSRDDELYRTGSRLAPTNRRPLDNLPGGQLGLPDQAAAQALGGIGGEMAKIVAAANKAQADVAGKGGELAATFTRILQSAGKTDAELVSTGAEIVAALQQLTKDLRELRGRVTNAREDS